MNKIIIALIIALITYNVSFAQSVFELKGKDIYITSITASSIPINNIPKECILDKDGNEYDINIIGRAFHVLDVKTNGSSKKLKSVDIILTDQVDTVVFRFPLQFSENYALLSMCVDPQRKETARSGVVYTTNIDNVKLTYYLKDNIDSLINKFPIGENVFAKANNKFGCNSKLLYVVDGYGCEQHTGRFYISLKEYNIKYTKKIYTDAYNVENRISLTDVYESFVSEKDVIDEYKIDIIYNAKGIDHWREALINKEVYWHGVDKSTLLSHIDSANDNNPECFEDLKNWYKAKADPYSKFSNYIQGAGFYWVKDIQLMRYNEDQSSDYKYFIIIGKSGNRQGINMLPFIDGILTHISYADVYRESLKVEKQKKAEEAEARAQIEAEAKAKEEAKWRAEYEQEQLAHKNNLIRKYGQKNAELILNRKVAIGFTKQMCIEAMGQPKYKRTRTTQNEVVERWTYDEMFSDYDTVLSFINDKLVQIDSL